MIHSPTSSDQLLLLPRAVLLPPPSLVLPVPMPSGEPIFLASALILSTISADISYQTLTSWTLNLNAIQTTSTYRSQAQFDPSGRSWWIEQHDVEALHGFWGERSSSVSCRPSLFPSATISRSGLMIPSLYMLEIYFRYLPESSILRYRNAPSKQRPLRRHRPRPSLHRFHLLPPHHRPDLQGLDFVERGYDAGVSYRFCRGEERGGGLYEY
jgi:hypothetical protein